MFISENNEIKNAFENVSKQNQYANEIVSVLCKLQQKLHTISEPKAIADETLKTACKFYMGDWAGIIKVDLELKVWRPLWSYNFNIKNENSRCQYHIASFDTMKRWVSSLNNNTAIYMEDVEVIKEDEPDEYMVYKTLNIQSFLAVPLTLNVNGFLVVKNPKRYINQSCFLEILSYVANNAINQQNQLNSRAFSIIHPDISHSNDVIINLFGTIEIYTSKGVIKETDLNAPKLCRLLVYLLLNQNRAHSPLEIISILGSNYNKSSNIRADSIRALIYRFRNKFGAIFENDLIITSANGYQINPILRIKMDIIEFDKLSKSIQYSNNIDEKINLIKTALSLYKGPVYAVARSEHWIFHTVNHYAMSYISLTNQLLELLAQQNDYTGLNHYASEALKMESGNMTAYFWRIYSIHRTGAIERLHMVLKQAKKELTADEYDSLLEKIHINGNKNLINLL